MKSMVILACLLATATAAHAQWQLLDSHTSIDLKGIDAVTHDIAWASGANGTVLRTEDGHRWQTCAAPPDAANLDFTSIQGFDTQTAVLMSSGRGGLSRVYKTTDGCRTWKKVFDNPNGSGSFESLHRATAVEMYLLGDPVDGKLSLYSSRDAGGTWFPFNGRGLDVSRTVAGIVAATASITSVDWLMTFGTAGKDAAVYTFTVECKTSPCSFSWVGKPTPVGQGRPTADVASVAGRTYAGPPIPGVTGDVATSLTTTLVAVGGDPANPDANTAVAAMSTDSGNTWRLAGIQPGGFRSAVAFDPKHQRFIAVGPNGTDVSFDDGVAWLPLRPGPHDAPDADKHWTSLSLPYVVGTKGRIGVLGAAPSPQRAVR
jgi:photosystem II stability/assembly factor-like uncharacterized protein